MTDAQVWRAGPALRLRWRDWGGDSVVYDTLTGETHQFSALGAAAMAWLEEQPCSTTGLAGSIANDIGIECNAELRDALAALIEQFAGLGWITPVAAA